jgi:hypothetical protein
VDVVADVADLLGKSELEPAVRVTEGGVGSEGFANRQVVP